MLQLIIFLAILCIADTWYGTSTVFPEKGDLHKAHAYGCVASSSAAQSHLSGLLGSTGEVSRLFIRGDTASGYHADIKNKLQLEANLTYTSGFQV